MVERRGGYRPTAPQNNPNVIRPLGGNGQSGRNAARFQGPKDIPSGGKYGEAKALKKMQQGALMAGGRTPAPAPIVPLDAPTQRPDEAFTVGMPFGDGIGPDMLGLPQQETTRPSEVFRKISVNDTSGEAEALYNFFLSRGL
jgi:hypothetical protein